ncbi:hypothetical protein [Eubacterium ventriosum]|uniref:Fibronectin type-III domain-containing protein n=1 Tax=Eubacterium ventriosum TaxID=39496 RepID=A0A413S2E1_9FIRM|nr:hypothetical protein [Eubacterium ventriosum]RHA55578.1 hypothetical protein DW929_04425 [Eubacterium ventriosum]
MKRMKKVLSIVLSLAMILTSITVYNTKTTKADDADSATPVGVEVTASVVNNMINVSWSQPDVEFASLAYFINYADNNIKLDSAHWAKAANGWCWTAVNPTEKRTEISSITKSNDNSIKVLEGGTFVITVQYLDAEGNVVATGTSNAVTTEKLTNTDLNLKVERYETGKAYLGWSIIGGAEKYEVYNADTNELMKTVNNGTDKWTDVAIKQGVTYNLVVKAIDENGEKIAITNNTTTAYQANTNMSLAVSYNGNVATLTWTKITNVSKYKVYDGDDEIAELDANVKEYVMSDLVENVEHNITIKAFDEAGNEITITNNTKTVVYSTTSKAPTEHTKADFSNSLWTTLSTKAGTVDNTYSINSDNTLSTGVWYGIYAPHSKAAYHGERTACILSDDAASFTFQQRNVTSAWINGNEYANPSNALNCQGDCTEISTEYLNAGINVITLVLSDGTYINFGIKVAEPLGVDATAEATQDTIDPSTVTEWKQMNGTTANGSKVYKDSTVTTSTDGGFDGCYAANSSPKWNISDIMNEKPVFGVVRGNTDSVIIDGTEYINAKDARSTKVYIGNDCIYVDSTLLDAPAGETQYHMITLTGGTALTFILKVVGPEKKNEYTVTVDNEATTVEEGENNYTFGSAEYGYFDVNNNVIYKSGTTITVTENMEFTSINTLSIEATKGVGIRFADSSGLRFKATITTDNKTALNSDAITEGFLITTNDIYTENRFNGKVLTVENKPEDGKKWFNDEEGTYCGSVVNIVDYTRKFVAKAYVTINYVNADAETLESDVVGYKSISGVANYIIDNGFIGNYDEKAQALINKFAGK